MPSTSASKADVGSVGYRSAMTAPVGSIVVPVASSEVCSARGARPAWRRSGRKWTGSVQRWSTSRAIMFKAVNDILQAI